MLKMHFLYVPRAIDNQWVLQPQVQRGRWLQSFHRHTPHVYSWSDGHRKVGHRIGGTLHGGSLASINTIWSFIHDIHEDLKDVCKSNTLTHCTYVMLIRNYGGHIAFATDSPFYLTYLAEYNDTKDPCTMMIQNPENYLATMLAEDMVLCRFLALNNLAPNCTRIIVEGVFSSQGACILATNYCWRLLPCGIMPCPTLIPPPERRPLSLLWGLSAPLIPCSQASLETVDCICHRMYSDWRVQGV